MSFNGCVLLIALLLHDRGLPGKKKRKHVETRVVVHE